VLPGLVLSFGLPSAVSERSDPARSTLVGLALPSAAVYRDACSPAAAIGLLILPCRFFFPARHRFASTDRPCGRIVTVRPPTRRALAARLSTRRRRLFSSGARSTTTRQIAGAGRGRRGPHRPLLRKHATSTWRGRSRSGRQPEPTQKASRAWAFRTTRRNCGPLRSCRPLVRSDPRLRFREASIGRVVTAPSLSAGDHRLSRSGVSSCRCCGPISRLLDRRLLHRSAPYGCALDEADHGDSWRLFASASWNRWRSPT